MIPKIKAMACEKDFSGSEWYGKDKHIKKKSRNFHTFTIPLGPGFIVKKFL